MQTSENKSHAGHLCENDGNSGGGCGIWEKSEAKKGMERMEDPTAESWCTQIFKTGKEKEETKKTEQEWELSDMFNRDRVMKIKCS